MREELEEQFPNQEFLFIDGMDGAIVGYDQRTYRVVYSVEKMLEILVEDHDMDDKQAHEYYMRNIRDAYMGDQTPICLVESVV